MKRTESQIEEQIALAIESVASGHSKWPGMSYEEGVRAALEWATGISADEPMEEE